MSIFVIFKSIYIFSDTWEPISFLFIIKFNTRFSDNIKTKEFFLVRKYLQGNKNMIFMNIYYI